MKLFRVEIVSGELASERDRQLYGNNILLSDQLGNTGITSSFWKGSNTAHFIQKAFGTPKAKLAIVATLCSISLAAGAAYNAAQTNCNQGLVCVTMPTRIMVGLSILSALVAWAKDMLF